MASEPDSPRDFGPFNTSATPTPLHTRSASPFQGTSMPHTPHEASQTMHRMRALFERRYEEDPNTVYLVDELPPLTEPEPVSSTNSNKPEQTKKERRLVPELDGTENVPDAVKYRYLALYLALNVGLTFLNKSTMIKFPFPFLLTALHAGGTTIGTSLMLRNGYFALSELDYEDKVNVFIFSCLYMINIGISAFSLYSVPLYLYQTLRTSSIIFTVLIYRIIYSATYKPTTYLSLIPIVLGVILSTSPWQKIMSNKPTPECFSPDACTSGWSFMEPGGWDGFTSDTCGVLLTLYGAVFAAIKSICTNRLQTRSSKSRSRSGLSAWEVLHRTAPYAFIQAIIVSVFTGEVKSAYRLTQPTSSGILSHDPISMILPALTSSFLAFALNVMSFQTNRNCGALSMAVAGQVKTGFTIMIALLVGDGNYMPDTVQLVGITLTLVGGTWYTIWGTGTGKGKPTSRQVIHTQKHDSNGNTISKSPTEDETRPINTESLPPQNQEPNDPVDPKLDLIEPAKPNKSHESDPTNSDLDLAKPTDTDTDTSIQMPTPIRNSSRYGGVHIQNLPNHNHHQTPPLLHNKENKTPPKSTSKTPLSTNKIDNSISEDQQPTGTAYATGSRLYWSRRRHLPTQQGEDEDGEAAARPGGGRSIMNKDDV